MFADSWPVFLVFLMPRVTKTLDGLSVSTL